MAFIAAASIAGGAALGLGGAYLQSQAAKDAAAQQADSANRALGFEQQMYNDESPYRQAGVGALSQMDDPYFQQTFSGMGSLQDDPGYQFRMDQGQKALESSAAARGGLMSGNTGVALAQYGQNYASNEYQNAYNRFNNNQTQRFNRLASIAGIGQKANDQSIGIGNNMANTMEGIGNAQAAATIGAGNAWSGALSGIGKNAMMAGMMAGGGGGGAAPMAATASNNFGASNYTMPEMGSSAGYGGGGGYSLGALGE